MTKSRAVILYRIDSKRNMRRFYRLDVQPDLFGFWLLVREWGRIGSTGRMQLASFQSEREAYSALERARRGKVRRRYEHG
jgi:predicted DNA-binding WGR domain protein